MSDRQFRRIKAISVKPPWSWAIVNKLKPIENRDWPTRYRGPLLIHAGKQIDKTAVMPIRDIVLPEMFDRGGFVGISDCVDCVSQSESPWFEGKYGFVLDNVRKLPFVAYPGNLGLFEVEVDYEELMNAGVLKVRRPEPKAKPPKNIAELRPSPRQASLVFRFK
jgi:hypothetical protein